MSIITTAKAKSKNLTRALCEAKVTKRVKLYDAKCPGLYLSASPTAPASFWLKYTDHRTHKRCTVAVGGYHPELFNVEHARTAVAALRWRIGNGEDVAQSQRQAKALQAKRSGVTVDQIIAERIEWMSTPVKKADGEMRPRIESWKAVASHLDRFVSPRLGKMVASEVTKRDIARLSDDIVSGKLGKPSVANARHMRRAASAMFGWAAEAGRDYVTASPCVNLPPLDEEHPRTRVLDADEIRALWHGLDRTDLPWDRKTRLALKFALVTMLRSTELLQIHRNELNSHDGKPVVDIAAKRVKKRRVINQPLSDLAMEILNEALGNITTTSSSVASAMRRWPAALWRPRCVALRKPRAYVNCSASRRSPLTICGARRRPSPANGSRMPKLPRASTTSRPRMPKASRYLRSLGATIITPSARTWKPNGGC